MRPQLCDEAMRLGRMLAGLAPDEAEVHGLVALMEIQASRLRARTGPDGEPVLLLDQDRARWDQLLIRRGLAALDRADGAAAAPPGPIALQAAIAACHARARTAGGHRLGARSPTSTTSSPRCTPVPGRRAQPRGRASRWRSGPAAGLEIVDAAARRAGARELSPAAERARRPPVQARAARRGAGRVRARRGLTRNEREKTFLLGRAAASATRN